MKPFHYLLVTLASAAITVACAPPNTAKPALNTTPVAPGAAAPASSAGGNAATPGGSTGGSTGGTAPGSISTPGGTTTPPGTVTPPGVGTGPVIPPVSEAVTPRRGGRGSSDACDPGDFTQVERLARPAVNEGLLLSNNLLNAFNSIPPTLDKDTGNATFGTTVTAVQTEAAGTLAALGNKDLTGIGLSDNSARVGLIVGSLLPDVMRFNSLVKSGYAESLETVAGAARPAAGRLLTDDTIDITLSVLVPLEVRNALSEPADTPDTTANAGVHSDFVDYLDEHRRPTNSFPYLVPPH